MAKNVLEELKKDLDSVDFTMATIDEYSAGFEENSEKLFKEMGGKDLMDLLAHFRESEDAITENGKLFVEIEENIIKIEKELGFEFKHETITPYNTRDYDDDHDLKLFYNSQLVASEYLKDTYMEPVDMRLRLLKQMEQQLAKLKEEKKVKKYIGMQERYDAVKGSDGFFDRLRAKGLESKLANKDQSIEEYLKLSGAVAAAGDALKEAYELNAAELKNAREMRKNLFVAKTDAARDIRKKADNYLRFRLAAVYDKHYEDLQYQEESAKEIIEKMIAGKKSYGIYRTSRLTDKGFDKAYNSYQVAKVAAQMDGKDITTLGTKEQYNYYQYAQVAQEIMKKDFDSKGKVGKLLLEAREKFLGEEKKSFAEMDRAAQDKIIDSYTAMHKKNAELQVNKEKDRDSSN